jgi:DNA-binding NtrC family response regulator
MVAEGAFREDLLYRINTIQIENPPLRERCDDIPMLVDYFKEKYESKYQKKSFRIEKDTLEKLKNYHWPGNVRELKHLVEKAIILSENNFLDSNDFLLNENQSNLIDTLDLSINEKQLIIKAIKKNSGNYTLAARELGVSRKTLYNKLKRYGLE